MSQWWMQNRENLPSVNEEQKKKIEYDTGKLHSHIKLMSSFLTNGYAPPGYGVKDYDHRYFYIAHDERDNKRCYCISGYARDHMADYLFQKGNLEIFTNSSWVRCIKG